MGQATAAPDLPLDGKTRPRIYLQALTPGAVKAKIAESTIP
jgi:hypothetical protein